MSIFNGSDISNLYVGDTKIKSAYVGDTKVYEHEPKFVAKSWSGPVENIKGDYIWTDGTDIYYSYNGTHLVLNKSNNTWVTKTWNIGDNTNFWGNRVWTNGTDIYFSRDGDYKLNKSTGDWDSITFSLSIVSGEFVWYDGDHIYYSQGISQREFDKINETWVNKTWTALPSINRFNGNDIWSLGEDFYFSRSIYQWVYNKTSNSWEDTSWNISIADGWFIWHDNEGNTYYSNENDQYILDTSNNIWVAKTWPDGNIPTYGYNIWHDGNNIYYSDGTTEYVLE